MPEYNKKNNHYYNTDCIKGCRKLIKSNTVDLIITDPPYGIKADTFHKHYNRNEEHVVDGYLEVDAEQYNEFSHNWIKEAARILKPGGRIYIVSGYTNLYHILDGLKHTELQEINHIIWKYNFGVYTKKKFISSHYHILYYEKPAKKSGTFNLNCRFGHDERDAAGGSLNYQDREDVWVINKEYKHGKQKNKNELPTQLLIKMIQYSSKPGDMICDLFLGGFSTAKVAIGLNRNIIGFELSKPIFSASINKIKKTEPGYLLNSLRKPAKNTLINQGKKWTNAEEQKLMKRFQELIDSGKRKSNSIIILGKEFGRGKFSIMNVIKKYGSK